MADEQDPKPAPPRPRTALDPADTALRRAELDLLHRLANAWAVMRGGRETLETIVDSQEAKQILAEMRQADERAGDAIWRLRDLL